MSIRRVKVTATANFNSGNLELTKEQYEPRKHNLRNTEIPLVFEIIKPVQFKVGEEIGFDGVINKSLADYLDADPVEDNSASPSNDSAARVTAIVSAVRQLPPDDESLYKADSSPRVDAIENILGYDITRDELDEALKQIADEEV